MEKYSVLMSVYSKENPVFFRQAVESMLTQSVKPSEVVLVCDGTLTPELDAVIDALYGQNEEILRVIRFDQNRGLGLALQAGVEACSYDLIARMDTDDIALPDRLEKQLKVMQCNPHISVVGGQIAEFMDTPENIVGYRVAPQNHDDICKKLAFRNPVNHVTVLFRKQDVLEAGNYQSLLGYEDYYLWARMIANGKQLYNIEDTCCYVRVNDAMYQRRGGVAYFKYAWKMEQELLRLNLIGIGRFFCNVVIRFTATVLVPDRIRGFLFRNLMRKKDVRAE